MLQPQLSSLMFFHIQDWEQGPNGGPALVAYLCPAGVWTIGYGRTLGVTQTTICTPRQAVDMLNNDLAAVQDSLWRLVSSLTWPSEPPGVSQGQWDGLVSLCFNCCAPAGLPEKAPHLWEGFTTQNSTLAAFNFLDMDHALLGGKPSVLPGLALRRAFEAVRYLGWV